MFPIYIPSYRRPRQKLFQLLPQALIVVEPQDLPAYEAAGLDPRRLLSRGRDGTSLAFARRFIFEHARRRSPWFWMIDDDVTGFTLGGCGTPCVKVAAVTALEKAERFLHRLDQRQVPLAKVGLEYAQWSFFQKKRFIFNASCDVCVCVRSKATQDFMPDERVRFNEDREMTLRALQAGHQTLRLTQLAFSCPSPGFYYGGGDTGQTPELLEAEGHLLERRHPGICQFVEKLPKGHRKTTERDVRFNWRPFKLAPAREQLFNQILEGVS